MTFTDLEKAAILQGLVKMADVDHNQSLLEDSLLMKISNKLGANQSIIRLASQLEKNPNQAIEVIRTFSMEKKELFAALLYMIMNADGVIHPLEEGFIVGTQVFYKLPEVSPERALKLYNDFITK